jgi:hypothetical protein
MLVQPGSITSGRPVSVFGKLVVGGQNILGSTGNGHPCVSMHRHCRVRVKGAYPRRLRPATTSAHTLNHTDTLDETKGPIPQADRFDEKTDTYVETGPGPTYGWLSAFKMPGNAEGTATCLRDVTSCIILKM